MADYNAPPGWTDAQWQKVQDAVTDSFAKASVVSSFLPCYGPLPEGSSNVRNPQVTRATYELAVDDADTLRFIKLRVDVPLTREQVSDDSLSSALLAFKRAATLIALAEDEIVFKGLANLTKSADAALIEKSEKTPKNTGLLELVAKGARIVETLREPDALIEAIVREISELDSGGHPGPFACVLSNDVFALAHKPMNDSLVMPADRIKPFLAGGPLLRSGRMGEDVGVIVSLASDLIDIVVATPPKVAFLQVTEGAKFLFRVYEKFVPRVKVPIDSDQPVRQLQVESKEKASAREALAAEGRSPKRTKRTK